MRFIKIINEKKFTLISMLLFFYVIVNLMDGERGLISYYEKQKLIKQLVKKEEILNSKLKLVEKNNSLLTDVVDVDYLEIFARDNITYNNTKDDRIWFKG